MPRRRTGHVESEPRSRSGPGFRARLRFCTGPREGDGAVECAPGGHAAAEELLEEMRLEMGALAVLRRGVTLCLEAADHATRELLGHVLTDEEHHVDWIEAQKHKIGEVGYENYVAQQFHEKE